ncbi:MAG: AmmeMemoRadiSam system protein B [Clostridiales bacterium]|nr:AmmeMemoRadiSam system protein B [Clostridiales bacterium]
MTAKNFLSGVVFALFFIFIFIDTTSETPPAIPEVIETRHAILNISHQTFLYSVENAREYEVNGIIAAGVVPHHTTAAVMISGFFSCAAEFADYYDTVIILAPNHSGGFAEIIASERDWDVGDGVFTNRSFVADLISANENAAISHSHMEEDHSASVLIPYVHYYLPNTQVATVLLSRSLSFDGTIDFARWLENWIAESGENILLVASIDFSHFLTPQESIEKDRITAYAIATRDYRMIHSLNDAHLDSSASLIVFLQYLDALGIDPQIIDHTNAAEFLNAGIPETTSYKIIIGELD